MTIEEMGKLIGVKLANDIKTKAWRSIIMPVSKR